jgi:hypothetical protein
MIFKKTLVTITVTAILAGAMASLQPSRVAAQDTPAQAIVAANPAPIPPQKPGAAESEKGAATGFVHTAGKHFVGPDGTPFAIRSINLGNWLVPEGYMFKFRRMHAPKEINLLIERLIGPADTKEFWNVFRENYVTEEDIRFLKAAGFNTVRVPLHYALFLDPTTDPNDPAHFDGPGYRLLDRVIGWCHTAGLKVIVDLHAAPGGQTGVNHDDGTGFPLVFYVPRYRRETIDLWRHLAARYRDDPTVLGYDLLNEPISPYNDVAYLNPRLEPLYQDIVTAIRSVDTHHVVFTAGAQWSTNFSVFNRPYDDNIAYTYHKFWASTERDSVQSYVNFANQYDVPIFLGESGELTDDWNRAFRKLNERFGISWSFWTFKNLDTPSTVLSVPLPAGWDKLAKLGNESPSDWDHETLPSHDDAKKILWSYLEAIKFRNVQVNASYLASLGLKAPKPESVDLQRVSAGQ